VKPSILVGVGLGVVFLAAGLVAPLLRSGADKAAEQAQDKAGLARRELARYNQMLPQVQPLANAAELKTRDESLAAAATAAEKSLKDLAGEYAKRTRGAQDLARQGGLPAPTFPAAATDAGGARRALDGFDAAVKANENLLKAALKDAQDAAGLDNNAIGVAHSVGMAEYVRAVGLLGLATGTGQQLLEAQAHLVDLASQIKRTGGLATHSRTLDAGDRIRQLRGDLDEIGRLHQEAEAGLKTLTGQVDEQSRQLATTDAALQKATAERLALEQQGFTVGDEASFRAYRTRYLALTDELRTLQERQQTLRHGAREGAEFSGEDLEIARLDGGRPVVGLETLQARLAAAQERVRRLELARVTLEDQIKHTTAQNQEAQREAARYEQQLVELRTAARTAAESVQALAGEALEKEEQALAAAKKAVQAFGQAQRSLETWLRGVRELQNTKDVARRNERLRLILQDPYLEQLGRSAEAAAQVLAGRVYARRVERIDALVRDVELAMHHGADCQFDMPAAETQFAAAQTDGVAIVEKAAETYQRMGERAGPTTWIPQGALAATHHLLAQIDDTQRDVRFDQAREVLAKALEKNEKSPYAQPLIRFRDALAAKAPAPPTAEPEEIGAPGEEPEKDFFLDDEEE
jgi:hypothetical protein